MDLSWLRTVGAEAKQCTYSLNVLSSPDFRLEAFEAEVAAIQVYLGKVYLGYFLIDSMRCLVYYFPILKLNCGNSVTL